MIFNPLECLGHKARSRQTCFGSGLEGFFVVDFLKFNLTFHIQIMLIWQSVVWYWYSSGKNIKLKAKFMLVPLVCSILDYKCGPKKMERLCSVEPWQTCPVLCSSINNMHVCIYTYFTLLFVSTFVNNYFLSQKLRKWKMNSDTFDSNILGKGISKSIEYALKITVIQVLTSVLPLPDDY